MRTWKEYPLVRVATPFALGIGLSCQWPVAWNDSMLWAGILLLPAYGIYAMPTIRNSYAYRWIFGVTASALFFLLGFFHAGEFIRDNGRQMIKYPDGTFSAIIVRPPEEKNKTFKLIIRIREVKEKDHWKIVDQRCLMYCEKDRLPFVPAYGDLILFHTGIKGVDPPMNPDQFDYRKYLQNQGIAIQAYVRSDDIMLLGKDFGYTIISISVRIRNYLKDILLENGIRGEEFAVLAAILLGDSRSLDAELRQSYAATGATHILCVSGLHVGVIYLIISRMLRFLERNKGSRIMRTSLIMGVIWLYAFITGCSPSVLRASAMFTFILLGKAMERQTSVYNSIAASALFLLCIDPLMILNLGFQLSYLAVLGIVLIQPGLSSIIMISNKYFKAIWDLVTVSIAAQIGTVPLVLYYFHQFPSYFLLTNLAVIPLSSLIIYAGLLLLAVSWIPGVAFGVAMGLTFLVKMMNEIIRIIEGIPGAVFQDISISRYEVIILFFLIAFMLVYFTQRMRFMVILALSTVFLILVSQTYRSYCLQIQSRVVVYHVPRTDVVAAFVGRNCRISGIWTDEKLMKMSTQSHLITSGIHHPQYHLPPSRETVCQIRQVQGLRYVEIKKAHLLKWSPISTPLTVDFVLISGSVSGLQNVLSLFDTRQIVLAPALRRREAVRISKEAERMGLKCHDVTTMGAFIQDKGLHGITSDQTE